MKTSKHIYEYFTANDAAINPDFFTPVWPNERF
jgi:hypothetical protein